MNRYVIEMEEGNVRGEYYWRLMSINGRTLAHSECYSSKAACIRIAKKLQADLEEGVDCVFRKV